MIKVLIGGGKSWETELLCGTKNYSVAMDPILLFKWQNFIVREGFVVMMFKSKNKEDI